MTSERGETRPEDETAQELAALQADVRLLASQPTAALAPWAIHPEKYPAISKTLYAAYAEE